MRNKKEKEKRNMKLNDTWKSILDIVLFLILFVLIQYIVMLIVGTSVLAAHHTPWATIQQALVTGNFHLTGKELSAVTILSSLLTILLFARTRWTPVSPVYLSSRPWQVLVWTALLTIGTILPSEWAIEKMQIAMPEDMEQLFDSIMQSPMGYAAIGILAPIAEEMVFRGAILRKLLTLLGNKRHWAAIALSAVLFGLLHGNLPQFIHAFVIGLLLGWLYYRTDSVIPGILFHWVNNTVAYIMFHLLPQMQDGKLIDLFHGDQKTMYLGLLFSLCIFIPSLLQLSNKLKKAQ